MLNNKSQKVDLYENLQLTKKATNEEIKASYKKLALKYHPDKNKQEDKQSAKAKFRQITQAYSVLNDPQKRQYYDKFGIVEEDLAGFENFQDFMAEFGEFQQFLDDFLSFNTMEAMFQGMNKTSKKGKKKGRAKNRNKNNSNKQGGINNIDMTEMMGMMGGDMMGLDMKTLQKLLGGNSKQSEDEMIKAMMQAMAGGDDMDLNMMMEMMGDMDLDKLDKQLQKQILQSDEQSDEDLTEQEHQILTFGQKNVEKKKVGNKKKKKKETRCKICTQKVQDDEILMHFSENHMNQFRKYQQQHPQTKIQKNEAQKYEQFDY